jgi:hypothetical protein
LRETGGKGAEILEMQAVTVVVRADGWSGSSTQSRAVLNRSPEEEEDEERTERKESVAVE